jgi:hypothetical protein
VIRRPDDRFPLENVYAGRLKLSESELLVVRDEGRGQGGRLANKRSRFSVETVVLFSFEGVLVR